MVVTPGFGEADPKCRETPTVSLKPWPPLRHGPSRYDELILPPGVARVTLGEGSTPLVSAGDATLKCEHLNPTGSYKDRIAAVAVSVGVSGGAQGWIGTSSGNAGAAFAAYGARAGLTGRLFTIDGIVPEKLAHVNAFAIEVLEVAGFGQDPMVDSRVFELVAELADAENLVLGITARAYNPHAMDGIKGIAFELIEELGEPPPAVFVPTGGGGLLASLWAGFEDARDLGISDRIPQLVAVQPTGCAPIHVAAISGTEHVASSADCRSMISGLQLPDPPDGDLALRATRESNGWTVAVSDEAALQAQQTLAKEFGVFVEPAAALAYAGYCAQPVQGAVVLMTGNGMKSLIEGERPLQPQRIDVEQILVPARESAQT